MKAYWWPAQNFGDTLSPIILEWVLKEKIEYAKRSDTGKILAVGSILVAIKNDDVVWGSGTNRPDLIIRTPKGAKFLAVRGPLTKSMIRGAEVPEVYGDPALLLPLIYRPEIEKKYETGIVPHYVDKHLVNLRPGQRIIDIQADWKKVVEGILSCEKIISSSLHGLIAAEAYGIPAAWIKLGNKIRGCEFKFNDYFLGTGRKVQTPAMTTDAAKVVPGIENLAFIQENLIMSLRKWRNSI